jgi:hypothetical protein
MSALPHLVVGSPCAGVVGGQGYVSTLGSWASIDWVRGSPRLPFDRAKLEQYLERS